MGLKCKIQCSPDILKIIFSLSGFCIGMKRKRINDFFVRRYLPFFGNVLYNEMENKRIRERSEDNHDNKRIYEVL